MKGPDPLSALASHFALLSLFAIGGDSRSDSVVERAANGSE